MNWPINPNKHRSLWKHADEFSNLGLNIMTLRMCVSCQQSTKVQIVNYFTNQIMSCRDQGTSDFLSSFGSGPGLRLVSTNVCVRRWGNWKSINSYGNLCDIRSSRKSPTLRNILVQNLSGECSKYWTFAVDFRETLCLANRLLTG